MGVTEKRVRQALAEVEAVLPGPDEDGFGPRWQALIAVGEFVEDQPSAVWDVIDRWGSSAIEDLRDAIATLLLEHLLEFHFEQYIGQVELRASSDSLFADTVSRCWKFGRTELPENSQRFDKLLEAIRSR